MSGSYQKPRMFRSIDGCCICRVKSSTSRFVASSRYQHLFEDCFKVSPEDRFGDICNACVLHIKRFADGKRSCEHVVDSRLGPRARNKVKRIVPDEDDFCKKHRYKSKKRAGSCESDSGRSSISSTSYDAPESMPWIWEMDHPSEQQEDEMDKSFFCNHFFKRKKICCGIIHMHNNIIGVDACLTVHCQRPSDEPSYVPTALSHHFNGSHNVVVKAELCPIPIFCYRKRGDKTSDNSYM